MNTRFIPGPDAAFHSWQGNLMSKVPARAAELNIPADAVTALQTLQTQWEAAYALAEDPATRTSITVKAKQKARKTYEAALRGFVRAYLTYNPLVSDADRGDLELPVHKTTRSTIPAPTELVEFELRQAAGSRVEVHFFPISANNEAKERHEAKPYGVRGAELAWAVLPEPPKSYTDLVHSAFDTRSPYTFQFDLTDAGKTIYVCARWENTTGQKGPWSSIKSAIIP
jgi:hypothetical protein